MALTAEKFSQGMTTQEYIDQIKVNKEPFREIYNSVEVPPDTLKFFNELPGPLQLAVFTADWCGDALSTTPTVLKLADNTDKLVLSVFNRDEELDLTNSFLPEHRAGTVPVFVVFDSSMNEISRFIETARSLVPAIDAMDESISQQVAAEAGDGDNARTLSRGKRTAFRIDRAREWGNVILGEFRQVLADGLALPAEQRPAEAGTQWPQP